MTGMAWCIYVWSDNVVLHATVKSHVKPGHWEQVSLLPLLCRKMLLRCEEQENNVETATLIIQPSSIARYHDEASDALI